MSAGMCYSLEKMCYSLEKLIWWRHFLSVGSSQERLSSPSPHFSRLSCDSSSSLSKIPHQDLIYLAQTSQAFSTPEEIPWSEHDTPQHLHYHHFLTCSSFSSSTPGALVVCTAVTYHSLNVVGLRCIDTVTLTVSLQHVGSSIRCSLGAGIKMTNNTLLQVKCAGSKTTQFWIRAAVWASRWRAACWRWAVQEEQTQGGASAGQTRSAVDVSNEGSGSTEITLHHSSGSTSRNAGLIMARSKQQRWPVR